MMKKLQLLLTTGLLLWSQFINAQELEVWVSDAGGFSNPPWFVYKADGNGDNQQEMMNQTDSIEWPEDIYFLEDENAVLVSNLSGNGNISKHNIETGEFIEVFAAVSGGPTRMKLGPDGLLYVLQWSNTNNKVLRFQLDGTLVDEFTNTGVVQGIGLDWDDSGNLYVSSYGQSKVFKFDTAGVLTEEFIGSGLSGPTNIFFDKSGNGDLIVFNWNNGIIKRFDAEGNFMEDLVTGVGQCEGVDFMLNGDILIGVGSDGTVKRYDSEFNFIENFMEGLLTPNAISIRDLTLSVPNIENKQNFIAPTMGVKFSIMEDQQSSIKSISVYTLSGRFIEKIEMGKSTILNAENYSEGMYLVKAEFKNGSNHTQKIQVVR